MYLFVHTRCLSLSIYIYTGIFINIYSNTWQNQYILTNPAKKTDTSHFKNTTPHFPKGFLQPAELRPANRGKFPKTLRQAELWSVAICPARGAMNVSFQRGSEPRRCTPLVEARPLPRNTPIFPGLKNMGTTTTIMLLKTRDGCVQRGWKWKLQFSSILRLRSGMKSC